MIALTSTPYSHESNLTPDSAACVDRGEDADQEQRDAQNDSAPQCSSSATEPLDPEPTSNVTDNHQTSDSNAGVEALLDGHATKLHEVGHVADDPRVSACVLDEEHARCHQGPLDVLLVEAL